MSDTELVQAEFLPNGLAYCMTDVKEDSRPLVDDAAVPKARVPDINTFIIFALFHQPIAVSSKLV